MTNNRQTNLQKSGLSFLQRYVNGQEVNEKILSIIAYWGNTNFSYNMRSYLRLNSMSTIQKWTITNVEKHVEKLSCSSISGRIVKWYSPEGNHLGQFLK